MSTRFVRSAAAVLLSAASLAISLPGASAQAAAPSSSAALQRRIPCHVSQLDAHHDRETRTTRVTVGVACEAARSVTVTIRARGEQKSATVPVGAGAEVVLGLTLVGLLPPGTQVCAELASNLDEHPVEACVDVD